MNIIHHNEPHDELEADEAIWFSSSKRMSKEFAEEAGRLSEKRDRWINRVAIGAVLLIAGWAVWW